MARVLFVCLHNAGRSQMSQAFFNRAAAGRHEAQSAGSTPGDRVHPEVITVMDEAGLDPDAMYTDQDTGTVASGRALMGADLPVGGRLPAGDWASAVIRLCRTG